MVSRIHYTVSMPNPNTHYFEIKMMILDARAHSKNGLLNLIMPVWTPGSYLVREFSRNVLDFRVVEQNNKTPVKCEKTSKNTWTLDLGNSEFLEVNYKCYAFEYSVDTSYLDTRHAIINGGSVFMYAEGFEKEELLLTVVPYQSWKTVSTGLERVEGSAERGITFQAPNYDVLIDSPIEIGNQMVSSFEVSGIKHEVSLFGPSTADPESFVSDLKRIVETTWPIFGEIPYTRYVFLVDFVGASRGGGLEHLNSTHCIVSRSRMMPIQDYRVVMSLFSHEFFHTWNVKRLRPNGLGPFDYNRETYTKSLWIAEGITSYYDDLILRRAEIFSVPEYLDSFVLNINIMRGFPSSGFQSAEESSFDTWIKQYRQDANSPNVYSSYYVQGAVIGWTIDMEIRMSTSNKKSLDEVMKKMYQETFLHGRGYSEEEFEATCNSVAGRNLSSIIFDKRVRGRDSIDFDHYLEYAGLKLGKLKNGSDKAYLGVKLETEQGRTIVYSCLFDTPANDGGLAPGDEIIALDDLRMDQSLISHYISNKKPGETTKVLISRDGYLETVTAKLRSAPVFEWRIFKSETASDEQQRFFKAWMLSDWKLPLEYVDYTASPQKAKQFDYV
jgi:predicted metalloprotease with PDZ domain